MAIKRLLLPSIILQYCLSLSLSLSPSGVIFVLVCGLMAALTSKRFSPNLIPLLVI